MDAVQNSVRIDSRDWAKVTPGERIYQIEVKGYAVLPDLLTSEHITQLKAETARLNTFAVDYSVYQQVKPKIQFAGGALTDLIAHPPTIVFLRELFGDEIIWALRAFRG